MDTRRRAALWFRVSNSDQSIENQRAGAARLCEHHHLAVVREFVADGFSAWDGSHLDVLSKAQDSARKGEYEVFIIWAMDRLTRQGAEAALRTVREFEEAGVQVMSVTEPWLSGNEEQRELMLALAGVNARMESTRRSERNRAASQRLAAQGIWAQGKPPLGYRRGADGHLEIEEDQASKVRLIFELYGNGRMGYRAVQKELVRRGVMNRKGSAFWPHASIEKIISDPVYTGMHRSGVPAPRLVNDELWEKVQERRKKNRQLKPAIQRPRYALQGRAKCECGATIRIERPKKGRGQAVYYCKDRYAESYRVQKTGVRCALPRRRVEEVERAVSDSMYETFADPEKFIDLIASSIERIESEINDLGAGALEIEPRIEELKSRMERLEVSWVEGRMSDETRQKLRVPMEEELAKLQERMAEADPDSLALLSEKRRLLQGAMDYCATAEFRLNSGLNMWQFAFHPGCAESDDLHAFRLSEEFPLALGDEQRQQGVFKLDRLLTQLGASVTFHKDHVEVEGSLDVCAPFAQPSPGHPHASEVGGS